MKYYKAGKETYTRVQQDGWKLVSGLHDGIIIPEIWERFHENKWQIAEAYDGFGHLISPSGVKIAKLF